MKFFNKLFKSKNKLNEFPKSSISSLAPKVLRKPEDIEKIQPYLDKLRDTIDAKDVNNIALTGGYGSGKSTILKTFKSLYLEYTYLNVSLAAFNQKEGKLENGEKEELERMLEISILQQIFYHVKPEQIPESRFKRIINRRWWHFLLIAVAFVIWVISSIMLTKFNYIDKINPENWISEKSFDWFALFFVLIAFSGIGLLAKLILQLFSNSKINKVNIKGELELGEKANKSVFNEHLEEILYFFERTSYNVVIIEDLDRFDNTDIFTKLREINFLLNNSNLIKREINFIYAVGDNLIKDKKERVKFFEYIIPVIPFINSSNAREQLQTLILESGLKKDIFSKEFMSDVITFIDDIDMRLLINIFHEFVIYHHTLKPEFVKKPEELFAIITYKNLEPEDFSKLNNREGKLYTLINNKTTYIQKFVDTINNKVIENEAKIEEIKKHNLTDRKELRSIYLNRIISQLPEDATINYTLEDLLEDEPFNSILEGKIEYEKFTNSYNNYGVKYYSKSNETLSFKFEDIEKQVDPNLNYLDRIKTIEEKNNSGIQKIQKDIAVIKKEQDVIKLWDLKQIFEKVDLNQYLEDFSNNMLLKNLILNGYINENYNDYISLFHEGSITKEDLSYERNVKSANPTDFDYKLHKIKGVLDRIDLRYFSKESILNFDMVNFLGNNYQNHSSYYNQIIELLSNNRERSIKFIDEYITDGERPIDIFIKKLTKQWTNFFNYVTEESNYQGDKIHNYLRLILTHADLEDILNQNHAPLVEMITYNQSFLSLVNTKNRKDLESKIQAVISKLDIKFSTLDNPIPETKILFDFIYQNNHYRVNKENILQMLVVNTEVFDKTTFETRNYSTIKKSDCKYLIEYIDKNINEYIRDIYLQIETNTKEEEKYLIELFNKKNITTYNSKIISDKMDAIISDVSTINDDDLIFHLLSISKIKASWENLHHIYYGYEETLDLIINFINMSDNAEKLSTAHVPKSKDEKGKMTFIQMWKDILSSPTLPIELFEQILQASDIGIKIFDFEKVEKERLEIMIKGNSFAFENNLFDQLEEYHSLGQLYLDSYKAELLKFIDTFSIDEQHLAQIFDSKNYISNEINIILSEFDITDYKSTAMLLRLKYRLSKESNLNITPQKIIETISVSRSDFFNVKVLVNYFDKFKREEIRDIINNLQDEEYRKILSTYSNESLKLEQTTYNNDLFQLLKDRNYISERSRKTKNGYQIFKNKTTNIL